MASEPPKGEEAVETVENPQVDGEGRPHVQFAGEPEPEPELEEPKLQAGAEADEEGRAQVVLAAAPAAPVPEPQPAPAADMAREEPSDGALEPQRASFLGLGVVMAWCSGTCNECCETCCDIDDCCDKEQQLSHDREIPESMMHGGY